MTGKSGNKVPEYKIKQVNDIAEKIKSSKTLMLVSLKNLPSKQFQEIKKSVRGKADVKVAKKNIMVRSIKAVGKESILGLEKHINENCAFIFSNIEGYQLAGILSNKKSKTYAKAGQISPNDIEVKAGPTDLPPGPAISELGSVGLQVAVVDGKLSIKNDRVIVKEGGLINSGTASILQKLNIQPFSVGLDPIAIYDVEEDKFYEDIKIDSEGTRKNLVEVASKALGFAQKIAYYCKDTIGYLLAKANMNAQAIEKLDSKDNTAVEKPAEKEKTEEKPAEEEKKEETDTQLNQPEDAKL